ncbi:SGNH/GDSL hydrolase family protein [Mesorhizobium xinjiangense]|uniref:SGNH/GDSL hydrolase family protein n=1 Tax=Mesorhizobium xinjiangense TaxID=2678685 RepID=UPI002E272F90
MPGRGSPSGCVPSACAPPPGATLGTIGGAGEPVRVLVVGDSSAASVGIDDNRDGLAALLAQRFHDETGRPVHWRAAGANSATAGALRDYVVPNLAAEPWTHIVLAVGTNDVKNFHTLGRFKREFGGLIYALRAKWPQARLVWSPVIDMTTIPALPTPLAAILDLRARAINDLGQRLCLERGAVPAERLSVLDPVTGFSSDGFHASRAGYAAWAEHLYGLVFADDRARPHSVSVAE